MYTKSLVTVWAIGVTYLLWAPAKDDGEPERDGLFGYTEEKIIGYREIENPDYLRVPCQPPSLNVAETRERYKPWHLAATIVATGLAWFLVAVAFWQRR
jgi:hypothetical protein